MTSKQEKAMLAALLSLSVHDTVANESGCSVANSTDHERAHSPTL